jgi:hypothetical protein
MVKKLISHCVVVSALIVGSFLYSCDTSSNVESPYSKYFLRYYGGDGYQTAADILPIGDGTYFLLGTTSSFDNLVEQSDSRIYLAKVDQFGTLIEEFYLGNPGDIAKDIEPTIDNNFIILVDHLSSPTNRDIKLIKINVSGEKLDSAVYGSAGYENGKSVTVLKDGGMIVTGATEYDTTILLNPGNPDDLSDIFHYRCDSNLNFDDSNWYEQDGSGTIDFGVKSFEGSGEFYVFGSSNQFHQGNPEGKINLYYSSLDAGGVIKNYNFLGDFQLDTESAFVDEMPEEVGGGYFVVASKLYPTGASSLHGVRLRSALVFSSNDEIWDRELPIEARNLAGVSGAAVKYGVQGYLILGTETAQDGTRNIWLTKIDLNGNVLWSRVFGSPEEDDFGAAVLETSDGRILVLGTVNLINGQSKLTLLKLNALGQLME